MMKTAVRLFCIGLFLLLTVSAFTSCDITQDDVLYALEEIQSLLDETDAGLFETSEIITETETETESQAITETVTETEPETETTVITEEVIAYGEYYYDVENVVLYLDTYGELPDNYMTKEEAQDLGWQGGSVERYQDGAAIGGNRFGNYEHLLPDSNWIECDIDTEDENGRGAKRLVFSLEDGLFYYTDDHYETFVEVYINEYGEVVYK